MNLLDTNAVDIDQASFAFENNETEGVAGWVRDLLVVIGTDDIFGVDAFRCDRFVAEAQERISKTVKLPAGYYTDWGGAFENQRRAMRTLSIIVKHRTDLDLVAERVGVKLGDGLLGQRA